MPTTPQLFDALPAQPIVTGLQSPSRFPKTRWQPAMTRRRLRIHISVEGRMDMNWDRVEGNWKQITGKVKEQWGKLTDDDLTVINGKQDQLVGRVQERYGIAKDEAERQVKDWADRM
jgi:uncharacterized protein YjbJ (UPF0337 family)